MANNPKTTSEPMEVILNPIKMRFRLIDEAWKNNDFAGWKFQPENWPSLLAPKTWTQLMSPFTWYAYSFKWTSALTPQLQSKNSILVVSQRKVLFNFGSVWYAACLISNIIDNEQTIKDGKVYQWWFLWELNLNSESIIQFVIATEPTAGKAINITKDNTLIWDGMTYADNKEWKRFGGKPTSGRISPRNAISWSATDLVYLVIGQGNKVKHADFSYGIASSVYNWVDTDNITEEMLERLLTEYTDCLDPALIEELLLTYWMMHNQQFDKHPLQDKH